MVGVDGSPCSQAALKWAVRQAELTGGTVQAVISWQYPAAVAGYGWMPAPLIEAADLEEVAQKTLTASITRRARSSSSAVPRKCMTAPASHSRGWHPRRTA